VVVAVRPATPAGPAARGGQPEAGAAAPKAPVTPLRPAARRAAGAKRRPAAPPAEALLELAPDAAAAKGPRKLRRVELFAVIGAGVALLTVGALAVMHWQPAPQSLESTLKAHSGLSFWTVDISPDGQHMTVHAPGLPSRPSGYRYQLWAWPKRGDPVSLVPLPVQGQAVYDLTPAMQQALTRAGRVAVIVEASGPRKGPPRVILVAPLSASAAHL
jgi:hypothetical protein